MANIKEELIKIFGAESVDDSAKHLAEYVKSTGFVKGFKPSFIVRAKDSAQVQALVKLCNDTKTPIVTVSSGGSHRHGGTVPSVPQAVILDLSGIKEVYFTNYTWRIAAFSAGLTYGELAPILAKEGLFLESTIAPRADKSVVASLLETEARINPNCQWNSSDPIRSTETVFGDGTLLRTGDAGMAPLDMPIADALKFGEEKFHSHYVGACGPEDIDYYRLLTGAQGTLGAVTWVSARCSRIPTIRNSFLFPTDDLGKAIEFMYNVEHIRFSDGLFLLSGLGLALLMGFEGEKAAEAAKKLPEWVVVATAASRELAAELRYKAQVAGLKECAEKAGVEMKEELCGISAADVQNRAFNPCEPGKYWHDGLKGKSADIFFLTTMDKVGGFVDRMNELAEKAGVCPDDIAVIVQPRHMGVCCRLEFVLPYCDACAEKVQALFEKASKEFCDMGGYFSRPYGKMGKVQLNKDAHGASVLARIKGIFDPNGIMNPGKLSVE
ncbi:MAG: FAD-binding oxidoreductase [Firmicutes bacterium]|nr:FAD-binding oxidoreductase [Bacillota bacterium]